MLPAQPTPTVTTSTGFSLIAMLSSLEGTQMPRGPKRRGRLPEMLLLNCPGPDRVEPGRNHKKKLCTALHSVATSLLPEDKGLSSVGSESCLRAGGQGVRDGRCEYPPLLGPGYRPARPGMAGCGERSAPNSRRPPPGSPPVSTRASPCCRHRRDRQRNRPSCPTTAA